MSLTATCYFRVFHAMRFPVEAAVGDYLAVMPPACPENLWVHEPKGLWVLRRRHVEEGKLWSLLATLLENGTLVMLHAPARGLLPHLVSAGELSLPQALRVLRSA
jgi:hypothetical protein